MHPVVTRNMFIQTDNTLPADNSNHFMTVFKNSLYILAFIICQSKIAFANLT